MKILLHINAIMIACISFGYAQKQSAVMPDSIFSGKQSGFHVQGIAIDKTNGFIYFSFTDKLVKTDLSGKLIGSVTGIVGHLGDLTFDPKTNTVYGSLEYKNDAVGKGIRKTLGVEDNNDLGFYIALFNGSLITKQGIDAGEENILKTIYLKEVVEDYKAEVKEGNRTVFHRFGCSGIDGITLAPSIAAKDNGKKYLYVAYGIYGDTTRNDNDHQVILKYNIDNWNAIGQKLTQKQLHHTGPEKPLEKYFIRTGNTTYGIQNLEYDPHSGNFFAAVYPGTKSLFPNYSLFVIDGHKKPDRTRIISNNKTIRVKTLSLLQAGERDSKTGIRGWRFTWGSTGLFPIGDGFFYISHQGKAQDHKQTSTLFKYQWIGSNAESFIRTQ